MKRLLFAILFSSSTFISWAQNYLIANNNPGAAGGSNVYTGASALLNAFTAAVDGDIIYVIPSTVDYGDLVITGKNVSLIGYGLDPEGFHGMRSTVRDIDIEGAAASGTRISGLHIRNVNLATGAGTYDLSNILIENSRIAALAQSSANTLSNSTIRNCNIDITANLRFYTTSNVVISHCILRTIAAGAYSTRVIGSGLTFQYCLFWYAGTSPSGSAFGDLTQSTLYRNIFYYTDVSNATDNNIEENLTFDRGGFDANNVLTNNIIDQDPLFEDFPADNGAWLDTWDITLQDGSPAIQDVNDRTKDIGPSGGVEPFDAEGNKFPLIQSLSVPTTTPAGSDMEVRIKAKGN